MKRSNKPNTKAAKKELKRLLTQSHLYELLDSWEKNLMWSLLRSKTIWIESEESRKSGEMLRAYTSTKTLAGISFTTMWWKYDIVGTWFDTPEDRIRVKMFLGIDEQEREESDVWNILGADLYSEFGYE